MNQNLDCAVQVIDIEIQSLLALKRAINNSFDLAVNTILSCQGRLIITGMGKSGLVGQRLLLQWHPPVPPLSLSILAKLVMVIWA